MRKEIIICDRCGKEEDALAAGSPKLYKVTVRGMGPKEICDGCYTSFLAIEDTLGKLKQTVLDDIHPKWFKNKAEPVRVAILVYFTGQEQPSEYHDIFTRK